MTSESSTQGTAVPAERLDVRGTMVAYRRKGSGPALVFFHEFGFSQRWLPVHERLSEHADVIAVDLQGFGDSPAATWMTGFEDLALHYAEFADALGFGPFHLVGHGFGGWVAAEFAAFYPERLRTLTLITPMGLRVPGHTPADLFRMSAEGRLDIMDAAVGPSRADAGLELLLQDYADLTGFGRFAWNPRYDIRLDRRLGRVTCPALVIGAEADRVVPAAHVERYAQLLPNAKTTVIRGTGIHGTGSGQTGHGVVIREPDAVAAEIRTFTEGH